MIPHRAISNRLHWMQQAYQLRVDGLGLAEDAVQLRCVGVGILLAAAGAERGWYWRGRMDSGTAPTWRS